MSVRIRLVADDGIPNPNESKQRDYIEILTEIIQMFKRPSGFRHGFIWGSNNATRCLTTPSDFRPTGERLIETK